MKEDEGEIFITTLAEIDRTLKEVQVYAIEGKTLPQAYDDYQDVFSKEGSDTLPPSRDCDHKIELTGENTLTKSPIYKMSEQELVELKRYLQENLDKGFIAPSSASFISLVLFIKKANSKLWFYIDY